MEQKDSAFTFHSVRSYERFRTILHVFR